MLTGDARSLWGLAWTAIRDASTPVPPVLDTHPLGQFYIDTAEFCREERDSAERAERRPSRPVEPEVKRADLYRRRWRRLRGNRGLR